jgi:hypothetical protein
MNGLSWRQKLILRAAQGVDYLPIRARMQINIPHKVWLSLVSHGYLRQHPLGWEITPEGRALTLWWTEEDRKALAKYKMRMAS